MYAPIPLQGGWGPPNFVDLCVELGQRSGSCLELESQLPFGEAEGRPERYQPPGGRQ